MLYVDLEKGWLPERFRGDVEFGDPMTKLEYTIHLLSRVKWNNLAIALLLIAGFGYGIFSFATTIVSTFPEWNEERHARYVQEELAKYEQVRVTIHEGDTAWTIQEVLTPNAHDLRDMLYLAEEVNGDVDWGNLLPGQHIIFLKEKNK